MADSVRVQFSASIGALISGVEDAKKAIESVRESTDRVADGAKSLLEVFGVAFSVDKIGEFINRMADLGERTESMAAILGVFTEEIGRLDAIAKGTGTSTEALARGIETFQVNIQKAQSSTSQQALALHALGLSAKDFIGLSIDAQLDKFSDAVSRFADGGNKMAAVRVLFGRLGDELIPFFDKGSAGFRELAEMADRAGTVLSSATAGAFEGTRLKLTELGLSVEGLGIRVFQLLEPAIDHAATALTHFIESIDAGTLEAGLKNVGAVVVNILETISTLFVEATADFQKLAAELGNFDLKRTALNILDPNLGNIVLGPTSGLDKTLSDIEGTARTRLDAIKGLADQYRSAIASFSTRPSGGGGALGGAPFASGAGLPQVPALAVPNKDALNAQREAFENQIKLADLAFKQTQEQLGAEVKLHQITYDQETSLLLAALDKRHAAETTAIDGELALFAKGTAAYQKALDERAVLDQKYAADRQKILNQQAEQDTKAWTSGLNQVVSAFDSQLKGLLSGTESWGKAMKNIFADLVIDAIKNLEKLAVEKAAAGLTSALGGPQAALGAVTGGISSLFGIGTGAAGNAAQLTATTANTTAIAALTTGVTTDAAGLTLNTTAMTAQTTGQAAQTTALAALEATITLLATSITAEIASIAALTAALVANTAALTVNSVSKLIPSFDVGSWSVPHDTLAMVHQGESIIPNNGMADAFRAGSFGGGGNSSVGINISGNVGNQAWFTSMAQQINRALQANRAITPSMAW
jgi:hypothetical protein